MNNNGILCQKAGSILWQHSWSEIADQASQKYCHPDVRRLVPVGDKGVVMNIHGHSSIGFFFLLLYQKFYLLSTTKCPIVKNAAPSAVRRGGAKGRKSHAKQHPNQDVCGYDGGEETEVQRRRVHPHLPGDSYRSSRPNKMPPTVPVRCSSRVVLSDRLATIA